MWRREYVVAKIGKCGVADRSLKLSLSRQVAFVIFIFILRIHISCLALPPTQIQIHNTMSTPQEREVLRAKVMADIERANAVMADLARAEEEEQRAAEEAERKRVEVETERKRVEEKAERKRAEEEAKRKEEAKKKCELEEFKRREAEAIWRQADAAKAAKESKVTNPITPEEERRLMFVKKLEETAGNRKTKRARAESDVGDTTVGEILVEGKVTWVARGERECDACKEAERRCYWRQDGPGSKRATACHFCNKQKKPCKIDGEPSEKSEPGPPKKRKVVAGKGKEVERPVASRSKEEPKPESESGLTEVMGKILLEIRGMRDEMRGFRMELRELRRTGREIAGDLSDLALHFIPEEGAEQVAEETKGKESGNGKGAETEEMEMDQTLH